MYMATAGANLSVGADAATGGKLWFTSTNGPPTRYVIVTAMNVVFTPDAEVNATQPNLRVERMSFAGAAAAAAAATPVQCVTSFPAPEGRMSAIPGGALTAGNLVMNFTPSLQGTATPDFMPDPNAGLIWLPAPIVLVAGEGLVLRQNEAGSAGESRTVRWTVCWHEQPLTTPLGRWFGPLVRN